MPQRFALLLTLAACTGEAIPTDSALDDTKDCGTGLWGESFTSVDELECAGGSDGPVPCHWSLDFGDGTYSWLSGTDTSESGTVTCDDNELVGTMTSASGPERHGTFHRATARVTWEGQSYEQVD